MTNNTMPGMAGTGEPCPENREALPGSDTGTGLTNNTISGDDYTRQIQCIARQDADRARLNWLLFLLALVTDCRKECGQ